jgi:hypothetical protein
MPGKGSIDRHILAHELLKARTAARLNQQQVRPSHRRHILDTTAPGPTPLLLGASGSAPRWAVDMPESPPRPLPHPSCESRFSAPAAHDELVCGRREVRAPVHIVADDVSARPHRLQPWWLFASPIADALEMPNNLGNPTDADDLVAAVTRALTLSGPGGSP